MAECTLCGRARLMALPLALMSANARAATITVNGTGDDVDPSTCTVRYAVQSINAGIGVGNCTTTAVGTFGTNDTIGFAGNLANSTITLSAQGVIPIMVSARIDGSGQTIVGWGGAQVLYVASGQTLAASAVTISGGLGTNGGAIAAESGSTLTLTNVTLSGNYAWSVGGALYAKGATVTLIGSTVANNKAGIRGGGIYTSNTALTLTNSTISGNQIVERGSSIFGGGSGISVSYGSATLDNMTISNNSTALPGQGGALEAYKVSSLTVNHSTLSGNSGRMIGGIYLSGTTAKIFNSAISTNHATCGASSYCGGGIYSYKSTLDVIDSTIAANTSGDSGSGGILSSNSATTLVNTTITGNSAAGNQYVGAAVWENHGPAYALDGLTLIDCTIAENTASGAGATVAGGLLVGALLGSPSKLSLANTIVSHNSPAGTDVHYRPAGATLSSAYSLLGTAENIAAFNQASDHNVFSDAPGLGPLQNNGGATQTKALIAGSPALSVGSVALAQYAALPLHFDQRGSGYPRVVDGSIDIGAFQTQHDRIFANGFELAP